LEEHLSDQHEHQRPLTTTEAGIPVSSDEYSVTVGPDGPTLLQDSYLIEKMAQFNRERVPERVVHAKGSGAFGSFEVTEDVTQWTRAAFLNQVGKRTPLLIRFSTVAGELGSADTVRDPRGFAIKFYTEEGNYDLVGNNTPVFFVRDASKFQDFIHSQKRMPDTDLRSNNAQWDFWSLSPALRPDQSLAAQGLSAHHHRTARCATATTATSPSTRPTATAARRLTRRAIPNLAGSPAETSCAAPLPCMQRTTISCRRAISTVT
jgi:hypothetical protein